ncbi:MAG: efflux transporter outer membrane subunit [Sphingomonas sp.]
MKRRALTAALLATLGGCTVGRDYARPELPVAPAFRAEALGTPVALGQGWWRAFGDPVLDGLIARGLSDNLDLAQAVARVSQARAAAAAAGAARLPAIEATGTATGTRQSLEGPLGNVISQFPGFDRNASQFDVGIGAAWEVDLFGGLARGSEAARADLMASEAGVIAARQMVAAEIADAYLLLRAAQVRLALAGERERDDLRLRDLVAMTVRAGITPRRDADLAEAQLAQTQAALPPLRLATEAQMNRIAVLTGQPPQAERSELERPAPIPDGGSVALGVPADLLRNRPDIIVAELRLVAANARTGKALSDYYPKFSLRALLGLQSQGLGALASGSAVTGSTVLGLRWRLFDFGRLDAEIAAARGREAELLAAYRLAVLRAAEDVENAGAARRERVAQRDSIRVSVRSLEQSVSALQAAYRAGTVSLIEVLSAQRQLSAATDREAETTAEVSRTAVAIARAVGAP